MGSVDSERLARRAICHLVKAAESSFGGWKLFQLPNVLVAAELRRRGCGIPSQVPVCRVMGVEGIPVSNLGPAPSESVPRHGDSEAKQKRPRLKRVVGRFGRTALPRKLLNHTVRLGGSRGNGPIGLRAEPKPIPAFRAMVMTINAIELSARSMSAIFQLPPR